MSYFRRFLLITSAGVAASGAFAQSIPSAEQPSFNMYGMPGLIDMPSAEMREDAEFSTSISYVNRLSRTNIFFQATPRLSGTFRYSLFREDEDYSVRTGFVSDRSFDFQYLLSKETKVLPSVSVGLRDFLGTGLYGAEYFVATKNVLPSLKVTAGVGWGRLSNSDTFRRSRVRGGGTFNYDQWFSGPAAPFGGIEWKTPIDRLTFKAEYSSDIYSEEQASSFTNKSKINFGLDYRAKNGTEIGVYSFAGNYISARIAFPFNLKSVENGQINREGAPLPVLPRLQTAAYETDWFNAPGVNKAYFDRLSAVLKEDGIIIETISVAPSKAELRIRNTKYVTRAQAVGRSMRAMSRILPGSIENFNVILIEQGIPAGSVSLARSDIENLEHAPNASEEILAAATIAGGTARAAGAQYNNPDLYPKLSWSFGPYAAATLFENGSTIRLDLGARLEGRYTFAPGLFLAGSVSKPFTTGRGKGEPKNSSLEPVRTNAPIYFREGDPALNHLTANYFFKLSPEVYGRATAGYIETMFGGVVGEVLYKPADKNWAVGAELAYVKQRDFNQRFGFQDYEVLTGHASLYYNFDNGFQVTIDAGRYLAGDWGASLGIDRTFANGWSLGAYATKTNVASSEFGEGNFDKGIRMSIPISYLSKGPNKAVNTIDLRSLNRDGGARLAVGDRLNKILNSETGSGLKSGFGKFWK